MILPPLMQIDCEHGIPRESGDDPAVRAGADLHVVVFPARAGMIPCRVSGSHADRGIPRESGDDPDREKAVIHGRRYSPRERG